MPNLKQTAIAVMAAILSTGLSASSMRDVFDSVNAQGNVSGPAMIQGQTMNYATGGSLFMRTPSKTYNLASVTPPSMTAGGCGGIDLYMGGFSYIGKDELVSMMKNIGSNALGYGFKLAIQNICPTCENVMQALQTTAQNINRLNIDSCEAAKGLVNATIATSDMKGYQQSSMQLGVLGDVYDDTIQAWRNVKPDKDKANAAVDAGRSKDAAEAEALIPTGNIVWKALKKIEGIDDNYRMMLMSMTGTLVVDKKNENIPYQKTISDLKDILSNGPNDVTITILKCADGTGADACLNVVPTEITMQSFNGMVRSKLDIIVQKMSTRSAFTPTQKNELAAFVTTTDMPVYKILAVGTRLNNTDMADMLMSKYGELIAAKYAQTYLEKSGTELRSALNYYRKNNYSASTDAFLTQTEKEVDLLQSNVRSTMALAYANTVSTYNVSLELSHLEKTMNNNLSQSIVNSLAFGNSLQR